MRIVIIWCMVFKGAKKMKGRDLRKVGGSGR